jgi:hypothetical protein
MFTHRPNIQRDTNLKNFLDSLKREEKIREEKRKEEKRREEKRREEKRREEKIEGGVVRSTKFKGGKKNNFFSGSESYQAVPARPSCRGKFERG